jgi:ATP-dependent protease Clp ATPase subunit
VNENLSFRKAVKYGAKLRFAVCGPSGSGKTYTLLQLATELGGPIALLDTEHGSASKYADIFEFDVLELDSYDPLRLIETH